MTIASSKYLTILAFVISLIPATVTAQDAESTKSAQKSDWDVSVGIGVGSEPIFEGSNKNDMNFMPHIGIEWRELVFFNFVDGLGINVYKGEDATLSLALGLEGGRNEEDDPEFLKGVGDVADENSANLKFEYDIGPLTPYTMVTQHLGDSGAMQARGGIEAKLPLALLAGKKLDIDENTSLRSLGPILAIDVSARWGNKDFQNRLYGVTAEQAANSAFDPYALDDGITAIDTDVSLLYPITDRWSAKLSAEIANYSDAVAGSPLTQIPSQSTYKLRIKYAFND